MEYLVGCIVECINYYAFKSGQCFDGASDISLVRNELKILVLNRH